MTWRRWLRKPKNSRRYTTKFESRMKPSSKFQIWQPTEWNATAWLHRASEGYWRRRPLLDTQLSSTSMPPWDWNWWQVRACNVVSARLNDFEFELRKRILVETFSDFSTINGMRVRHYCMRWIIKTLWKKWQMFVTRLYSSRIDRYICHSWSPLYLTTETKLHCARRISKHIRAPETVQRTLNQPTSFG